MKKCRKLITIVTLLVFSVSNYTSAFANIIQTSDSSLKNNFISKYQALAVKDVDFNGIEPTIIKLSPDSKSSSTETDEKLTGDVQLLLSTDKTNLFQNFSVIKPNEEDKLLLPNLNIYGNIYKTSNLLFKPTEDIDSLKIFIDDSKVYVHNEKLTSGTQYMFNFEDADLNASTIRFEAITTKKIESTVKAEDPIKPTDPIPPTINDKVLKTKTFNIAAAPDNIDFKKVISNEKSSIKLGNGDGTDPGKLIISWNETNNNNLIDASKYGDLKVLFKDYTNSPTTGKFTSTSGSNEMKFEVPLDGNFVPGKIYDYELFFVDKLGRVYSETLNFTYPVPTNLDLSEKFPVGNEELKKPLLPETNFSFDISSNEFLTYVPVNNNTINKTSDNSIYVSLEKLLEDGSKEFIPVANPTITNSSDHKYTFNFNCLTPNTRSSDITNLSSGDYSLKVVANSNYDEKNIQEKEYLFSVVGKYPELNSNINFNSVLDKSMDSVIITSSNSTSSTTTPLPNAVNLNFNLPKGDSLASLKVDIFKDDVIVDTLESSDLYLGDTSKYRAYKFENDGTYKFKVSQLTTTLGYDLENLISSNDLYNLTVVSDKSAPLVKFKEVSTSIDNIITLNDISNSQTLIKGNYLGILVKDLTIDENNFSSLNPNPIILTNKTSKEIIPAILKPTDFTNSNGEILFNVCLADGSILPDGRYSISPKIIDAASNESIKDLSFIVDNKSLEKEVIEAQFLSDSNVPDSNLTKYNEKYYFNSDINLRVKLPVTASNYSKVTVTADSINSVFTNYSMIPTPSLSNSNVYTISKDNVNGGEFIDFKVTLADLESKTKLIDSSQFNFSIKAKANNGQEVSLSNLNLYYDSTSPKINQLESNVTKLIDDIYYSNVKSFNFKPKYSEIMNLGKTMVYQSDNNGASYTTLNSTDGGTSYNLSLNDNVVGGNIYSPKLVRINGVDLAGNTVEKEFKFYFDSGAPIISSVYPTDLTMMHEKPVFKVEKDKTVKLSFKNNSTGVNISPINGEFIVNINDKTAKNITASVYKDNVLITKNSSIINDYDLGAGSYKVIASSDDAFGNNTTKTFEFYVDDSKPIVSVVKFIKNDSNSYSKSDLSDFKTGSYTTDKKYSLGLYIKDTTFNKYEFDYSFDIQSAKPKLVPATIKKAKDDSSIDEYLFVLDDTNVSAQGVHKILSSATDILGQTTKSDVNFVIDDSTPNFSDLSFEYIDSASKEKPYFVSESSRVSLKDDFKVNFNLDKIPSGYKSIKVTLSDPNGSIDPIIKEFTWSEVTTSSKQGFTAEFKNLVPDAFIGNRSFNLKMELINGADTHGKKEVNVHYDTVNPTLKLNNDNTEITENKIFGTIPNISSLLSDYTFFNDDSFKVIENIGDFNVSNAIGITSFSYQQYEESANVPVENVKLSDVDKDGNFNIVTNTPDDNKYVFKSGVYTVKIKACDSASNFTEKSYRFLVDTITPEIEVVNIKDKSNVNYPVVKFDDSHYLNNDDLSIVLKFNKNVSGYKNIQFVLNPNENTGLFKKKQTILPSNCLTHPDGKCTLDSNVEHEFKISDLLANLKNKDKLLENLDFKIAATLTSNSDLSSTLPISMNIDNVKPVLNMTTSLGADIKNNFNINPDPLVILSDKTLDLPSLVLNPTELKTNSVKIIESKVKKVDSDVYVPIGSTTKLEKYGDNAFKIYTDGSDSPYIFNSGDYQFTIESCDLSGNTVTETFNFSVELEEELAKFNTELFYNSSTPTIPTYNGIYYPNNTFRLKVNIPESLKGYSNLTADLKLGVPSVKNSVPTIVKGKCITHDISCVGQAGVHEFEYEITDKSILSNASTDLYLDITSETTFGNLVNKSIHIKYDTKNVTSKLSIIDINGVNSSVDIPKDNTTSVSKIGFNGKAQFNVEDPNYASTTLTSIKRIGLIPSTPPNDGSILNNVELGAKDGNTITLCKKGSTNEAYTLENGKYEVVINTVDLNGNSSNVSYTFIVESSKPTFKVDLSKYKSKAENKVLLSKYNDNYYTSQNILVDVSLDQNLSGFKDVNLTLTDKDNKVIDIGKPVCTTHTDCTLTDLNHKFEVVIPKYIVDSDDVSTKLYLKVTTTSNAGISSDANYTIIYDNNTSKIDLSEVSTTTPKAILEETMYYFKSNPKFNITLTDPSIVLSDSNIFTIGTLKENSIVLDKMEKRTLDADFKEITKDVIIKIVDGKLIFTDSTGKPYTFENGVYSFKISTMDFAGTSYTSQEFNFTVDSQSYEINNVVLSKIKDSTTINNTTLPSTDPNISYYLNGDFNVTFDFPKTISSYKSLSVKLTNTDAITGEVTTVKEYNIGCNIHADCNGDVQNGPNTASKPHDISPVKSGFTFAIPETSNGDNLKLDIKLVSYADDANNISPAIHTETIRYDKSAPTINLVNKSQSISNGAIFDFNSNLIVDLDDDSILNKVSYTVASKDALALNSINVKSVKKQTLEDNTYLDITKNITSIENSDYNSLKFLSGSSEYLFETGKYIVDLESCDLSGNTSTKTFSFIVDTKDVSKSSNFSYTKVYGNPNNSNDIVTKYDNETNNTFYIAHTGSIQYTLDGNVSGFNNSFVSVSYTPVSGSEITGYFDDIATNVNGLSATGDFTTDMARKSFVLNFQNPGTYVVKSSVKANNRNIAITNETTIIVDHQDPSIKITPQFSDLRNLDGKTYTKDSMRNFKINVVDTNSSNSNNLRINTSSLNEKDGYEIVSHIQNDGDYNISVNTTDKSGRTGSDNLTLVVDTTKPNVTASNSFNNFENKNFTNQVRPYNYTVSDTNKNTDTLSVNGSVLNSTSSISGDGLKTVIVSAEDKAGNVTTLEPVSFILDTVAPNLAYKDVIAEKHYNVDVKPTIDATDEYLNKPTFLVTLNNSPYNKDSIGSDGSYVLQATANDYAGNLSTISIPFVVDKIAPVITIEGILEEKVNAGSVKPIIKVDDSTATVKALLNGDEYFGHTIIGSSKYTLLVSAVDKAGNLSRKAVTFMLDSELPIITIDDLADGDTVKPGFKPKVTASKGANVTMLLNGNPYDGKAITDEGDYILQIFAKDSVGNENETTLKFTVSSSAPVTASSLKADNKVLISWGVPIGFIVLICVSLAYVFYKRKSKARNSH